MTKRELIRENNRLRLDNDVLNKAIRGYKDILKETRAWYGTKLLELENERLSKEHPDVIATNIEWAPVENNIMDPKMVTYKFIYEIKGEW